MEQLTLIPARIKVASVIRKAILSGEFSSGQQLSLTETARRLGISRTPVREAFQMLESDGLISLRMNRGAIVNTIDERFITDHYEMRILLEGEAAYRAAVRGMDTAPLEAVHQGIRSSLQAGDASNYIDSNQFIHTQIWTAADNRKLYSLLMNLWNGPSIGRGVSTADHQYLSTVEHGEIIDYIKHHDGERARRAMARHIERSMENILRSFQIK